MLFRSREKLNVGASRPWGGVNLNIPVLLGLFQRLSTRVQKHRYGLAAFLIPTGVRAIPEIIVGPYPVGWDTIAFYVPNTLDWAGGRVGWLEMLGTAPLMYMISVPLYRLGTDPVFIFKLMGPILFGSMIWALFRFTRLSLQWESRSSLYSALAVGVYFVTLRTGWDLYRNMLGLTFVLLSLPVLGKALTRLNGVLLSSLIVLAVASDQLTGVIMLVIVGWRASRHLFQALWDQFVSIASVASPGAVLFLAIVYAWVQFPTSSFLQPQPLVPSSENFWNSAGFVGFLYLPLSPLVFLGFRRVPNPDLRAWTVFCLVGSLATLLPFVSLSVMSYRWSLLLALPFGLCAMAGATRLVDSTRQIRRWPLIVRRGFLSFLFIGFALSGILYVALPAEQAVPYYALFPGLLPSSMVQNSVPLSDMGSLRQIFSWLSENMTLTSVLVSHQAIYGWAREYLPSSTNVINYGYLSPVEGAQEAVVAGFSRIMMVWWVNGTGWHGQVDTPREFVSMYQVGRMVVYSFEQ